MQLEAEKRVTIPDVISIIKLLAEDLIIPGNRDGALIFVNNHNLGHWPIVSTQYSLLFIGGIFKGKIPKV